MLSKFGIKIGLIIWVIIAIVLFVFGGKEPENPHAVNLWEIAQKLYNIVLLFDIILYLTGGNLKTFFSKREQSIKEELDSAATNKKEIECRIDEMRLRMASLDAELEKIIETAKTEAAAEKEAILEKARKEAGRLIELTKREIELEYDLAKKDLKARVASLALERSEEIMMKTIKPKDAEKLIEDNIKYLDRIKK